MISHASQQTPKYAIAALFGVMAVLVGVGLGVSISMLNNPLIVLALLAAALFGGITLIYPQIGVLGLAAITFTSLSDVLIRFHGMPSIAQPYIALLVIEIGISWLLARRRPVGWTTVALWVLLNSILVFASLLYAQNGIGSKRGVEDFVKDSAVAIIVAFLIQTISTMRHTVWAMLAVALFLGTISVYQALTNTYSNNYWGFGQTALTDLENNATVYRIGGPFESANFYAQILLLFVPMALNRLVYEQKTVLKLLAGWALAVCVVSILWTFSRGAFLGLVVMVAYMFFRHPPRPIILGICLFVALCAVPLIPANYTERIATIVEFNPFGGTQDFRNADSFRGRTSENLVGWQIFRDHPVVGVGFGNYSATYLEYSSRLGLDPRLQNRSAHNLYLEVASEQGLLGLTIFLLMLLSMFRMLRTSQRLLHDAGHEGDADLVRSIEYGMVGYLTAGWFLHLAFARPFWFMVGLAMASLHVAQSSMQHASKHANVSGVEIVGREGA